MKYKPMIIALLFFCGVVSAQTSNTYTSVVYNSAILANGQNEFESITAQFCGSDTKTVTIKHWRVSQDGGANNEQTAFLFYRGPAFTNSSFSAGSVPMDSASPASVTAPQIFGTPFDPPNGLKRIRTWVVGHYSGPTDAIIDTPFVLHGHNDCIAFEPYSFVSMNVFSEIEWVEGP